MTCISNDQDVIQELHWDTTTRKLEVVHEINLDASKNARWRLIHQYAPGNVGYAEKCKDYSLNSRDGVIITEFEYDEYDDANSRYAHAVKFPESGDYYPLSQLPHLVTVKLNRVGGSGTVSTTSGEALPT
jgi:hypothetical protein